MFTEDDSLEHEFYTKLQLSILQTKTKRILLFSFLILDFLRYFILFAFLCPVEEEEEKEEKEELEQCSSGYRKLFVDQLGKWFAFARSVFEWQAD